MCSPSSDDESSPFVASSAHTDSSPAKPRVSVTSFRNALNERHAQAAPAYPAEGSNSTQLAPVAQQPSRGSQTERQASGTVPDPTQTASQVPQVAARPPAQHAAAALDQSAVAKAADRGTPEDETQLTGGNGTAASQAPNAVTSTPDVVTFKPGNSSRVMTDSRSTQTLQLQATPSSISRTAPGHSHPRSPQAPNYPNLSLASTTTPSAQPPINLNHHVKHRLDLPSATHGPGFSHTGRQPMSAPYQGMHHQTYSRLLEQHISDLRQQPGTLLGGNRPHAVQQAAGQTPAGLHGPYPGALQMPASMYSAYPAAVQMPVSWLAAHPEALQMRAHGRSMYPAAQDAPSSSGPGLFNAYAAQLAPWQAPPGPHSMHTLSQQQPFAAQHSEAAANELSSLVQEAPQSAPQALPNRVQQSGMRMQLPDAGCVHGKMQQAAVEGVHPVNSQSADLPPFSTDNQQAAALLDADAASPSQALQQSNAADTGTARQGHADPALQASGSSSSHQQPAPSAVDMASADAERAEEASARPSHSQQQLPHHAQHQSLHSVIEPLQHTWGDSVTYGRTHRLAHPSIHCVQHSDVDSAAPQAKMAPWPVSAMFQDGLHQHSQGMHGNRVQGLIRPMGITEQSYDSRSAHQPTHVSFRRHVMKSPSLQQIAQQQIVYHGVSHAALTLKLSLLLQPGMHLMCAQQLQAYLCHAIDVVSLQHLCAQLCMCQLTCREHAGTSAGGQLPLSFSHQHSGPLHGSLRAHNQQPSMPSFVQAKQQVPDTFVHYYGQGMPQHAPQTAPFLPRPDPDLALRAAPMLHQGSLPQTLTHNNVFGQQRQLFPHAQSSAMLAAPVWDAHQP